MRHKLTLISVLIILLMLLCACGNGVSELDADPLSSQLSLDTRPIPSEYVGLSMAELKDKSTTPIYRDVTIDIENYKGKLIWYEGKVDRLFKGSKPNTFQVWVHVTHVSEVAGTKVDKWRDPILLLYSLERGPELKADDSLQFVGTVLGLYVTSEQRLPGSGMTNKRYYPQVNAIKVDLVDKLDK